jgi:hypothetical protein
MGHLPSPPQTLFNEDSLLVDREKTGASVAFCTPEMRMGVGSFWNGHGRLPKVFDLVYGADDRTSLFACILGPGGE